ncbi:MAG: amidohydrolase family protein [Candidatus Ranarchaeia archaeon]|jgi:5-methylthioadenosine/S-adenosylhomocysteine deaminase
MTILGNASWILTMNSSGRVIKDGAVLIQDDTIVDVGKTTDIKRNNPSEEFVDLNKHILLPGLVNAHMHSVQVLFRGLGADSEIKDWILRAKMPILTEASMKEYMSGLQLGFLESVKTGATTNVDNQDSRMENKITEKSIEFAEKLGFRVILARGFRPLEDIAQFTGYGLVGKLRVVGSPLKDEVIEHERLLKKYVNTEEKMVKIYMGMLLVAHMTEEGLMKPFELAEKYDSKLHFHLAENRVQQEDNVAAKGIRGVEWLDKMGVLGDRIQIAHGVWLSDNEVDLLSKNGGHVLHCAASNAYLSSGVANIPNYLKKGVNVALGTDGAGSNDTHDMMDTLRISARIAKITHPNEQVITAKDVLTMATIGGAKAQGMENEIGSIEVGKKADIIGLSLDKTRAIPVFNPYAAVIFALDGSDVSYVMINGKPIISNYTCLTVDESEIMGQAEKAASAIYSRILDNQQ